MDGYKSISLAQQLFSEVDGVVQEQPKLKNLQAVQKKHRGKIHSLDAAVQYVSDLQNVISDIKAVSSSSALAQDGDLWEHLQSMGETTFEWFADR